MADRRGLGPRAWTSALDGREHDAGASRTLALSRLCADLPVALCGGGDVRAW